MNSEFILETKRLILRPWSLSEIDRTAFHFLMSDEQVRRFYPTRKTRSEADALLESLVQSYAHTDKQWVATCWKETGEPIGFTGLANVNFEAPFTPAVEIGWIYKPSFWRQGLASEAARSLVHHGFNDLNIDEIVAFTAKVNAPSAAVMHNIGMTNSPKDDFDHPAVEDDAAHLRPHVLYKLNRTQWREQKGR